VDDGAGVPFDESPWTALTATNAPATSTAAATTDTSKILRDLRFT
jgi:hypothetical protein